MAKRDDEIPANTLVEAGSQVLVIIAKKLDEQAIKDEVAYQLGLWLTDETMQDDLKVSATEIKYHSKSIVEEAINGIDPTSAS